MDEGEFVGLIDSAGSTGTAGNATMSTLIEPARLLSPSALVDAVRASEQVISYAAAAQSRLLAEFAMPGRYGEIGSLVGDVADMYTRTDGTVDVRAMDVAVGHETERMATAEVAAALRISPGAARYLMDTARTLAERLPGVLDSAPSTVTIPAPVAAHEPTICARCVDSTIV